MLIVFECTVVFQVNGLKVYSYHITNSCIRMLARKNVAGVQDYVDRTISNQGSPRFLMGGFTD